jgi:hypothetical protein
VTAAAGAELFGEEEDEGGPEDDELPDVKTVRASYQGADHVVALTYNDVGELVPDPAAGVYKDSAVGLNVPTTWVHALTVCELEKHPVESEVCDRLPSTVERSRTRIASKSDDATYAVSAPTARRRVEDVPSPRAVEHPLHIGVETTLGSAMHPAVPAPWVNRPVAASRRSIAIPPPSDPTT